MFRAADISCLALPQARIALKNAPYCRHAFAEISRLNSCCQRIYERPRRSCLPNSSRHCFSR